MEGDDRAQAALITQTLPQPQARDTCHDAGITALARARLEPRQEAKTPPCAIACAVGGDVRGWIGVIAQRRKLRISDADAYARAWTIIAAVNPFPATLGRICPHPCEVSCMRGGEDGAVAINALERFVGDWALRQRLSLPMLETRARSESIGVIGAGPAGLSFAYQMARRGYRVTVYERRDKPGGMLQHGIPPFRLPPEVLDAEIRRVLDIGVQLKTCTAIGHDVSADELRRRHSVLFIGIGASRGIHLNIPGERGRGVWRGVDYLSAIRRGEAVEKASRVIVVGGGNTAVDAARVARRKGASVTMIYRRTLADMPANVHELDAALSEGVVVEQLSSLVSIERSGGAVTGVVARRMTLAAADGSGRRRPVPLAHSEFILPADAVIVAVSQESDWSGIDELRLPEGVDAPHGVESCGIRIFAGGDLLKPGIAGFAIAQGRRAAETAHAKLRGLPDPPVEAPMKVTGKSVKAEYYPPKQRACVPYRPVRERLLDESAEAEQALTEQAFLGEVTRCFSCGLCYGCEQCFMYCTAGAFNRLASPKPGAYFELRLDCCEGCGKCVELCPCGYLSVASQHPQ